MHNKIVVKDGAGLIGVSGIAISQIDNTIFINNSCRIEEGTAGSLAFYSQDSGSTLHSTRDACVWNRDSSTLTASNLRTTNLVTDQLTTDLVTATNAIARYSTVENLTTDDIHISGRIEFNNFKIKQKTNAHINAVLRNKFRDSLLVSFVEDDKNVGLIAIDKERTYFNCSVNVKSKTVESPIGSVTDLEGDIAIDENYICYCIQDYNGTSNIWKRSKLTSW